MIVSTKKSTVLCRLNRIGYNGKPAVEKVTMATKKKTNDEAPDLFDDGNRKKLFLLDGMALIYRAHFALIRSPRFTSGGKCTSGVFGMANTVLDIINRQKPTHLAVAFDTSEPTQRHIERGGDCGAARRLGSLHRRTLDRNGAAGRFAKSPGDGDLRRRGWGHAGWPDP